MGNIFSWDPETKKTGVVLENAGNDNAKTSTWLEPFSNGLLFNPINQELYICEHGNRGIKALNSNDQLRQITKSDWILNSPNDLALQKSTGDIFFTDPFFGKMTFNANFERGNLDQIPNLAEPGYSGIYRIRDIGPYFSHILMGHKLWLYRTLLCVESNHKEQEQVTKVV